MSNWWTNRDLFYIWSSRENNDHLLRNTHLNYNSHWIDWFRHSSLDGNRYNPTCGQVHMSIFPYLGANDNNNNDLLIVEVRRKVLIGMSTSPIIEVNPCEYMIQRVPDYNDGVEIFIRPPKEEDTRDTWNHLQKETEITVPGQRVLEHLDEVAKLVLSGRLGEGNVVRYFFHRMLFDCARPYLENCCNNNNNNNNRIPESVVQAFRRFVPESIVSSQQQQQQQRGFVIYDGHTASPSFRKVAEWLRGALRIDFAFMSMEELLQQQQQQQQQQQWGFRSTWSSGGGSDYVVLFLFASSTGRVAEEYDFERVKKNWSNAKMIVLRYGTNPDAFIEEHERVQLIYNETGVMNVDFNRRNVEKLKQFLEIN